MFDNLEEKLKDPNSPESKALATTIAIVANLQLVEKLEEIAGAKGVTASQLALAWVLMQGADIVPIPGTKRVKYLEQNAAASDIILSQAELAAIEEVFPKDAASGLRYPEAMMQAVNR